MAVAAASINFNVFILFFLLFSRERRKNPPLMRADSSVDNAKGITIRHHMQAKILDFFLRPSKRPKAGSPLRTLHLCKKYRLFRGLRKKGCGQTPVILQGNGHYARLQFCVFLEWVDFGKCGCDDSRLQDS